MDWTCPQCGLEMADSMEIMDHREKHHLNAMEDMMRRVFASSAAFQLAATLAEASATSGRPLSEVLEMFQEAARKLLESGLFGQGEGHASN